MSKKERVLYRLLNSILVRNAIAEVFVDWIIDNFNIIRAVFGIKVGFVGQIRLAYRVFTFFSKGYDRVTIKSSGIYSGENLLEDPRFHIMDLMPVEGIELSRSSISEVKQIINKLAFKKDDSIGLKYYRVRGLFKLVMLGYIISFLLMIYIFFQPFSGISEMQKLFLLLWLIPNAYFFSQTILFYISRLKHLTGKVSFKEADEKEEKQLILSTTQPYVISVVPAYMEEADLLKRTLYSLCLQDYRNMHVVMLLGNDCCSSNETVIVNTMRMKSMAIKIKRDVARQKRKIGIRLRSLKSIGNNENCNLVDINYMNYLKYDLKVSEKTYRDVAAWFIEKARDIKNSEVKYPIDSYLVKHTFVSRYIHFKRQSVKCRKLLDNLSLRDKNQISNDEVLGTAYKASEFYTELKGLFNITLEVFMRTRFENLEQEKTKAGNLTAYSSIIGGTWSRKKQPNGRFVLIPSEAGKHVKEPKYFASFDSDTIAKPNYIVRKVAFLERKINSKVGLIQSPYVMPTPEPSNVASASGVHSYWFLPVSVGLSFLKSAYWLGFNGVLRFEAVKRIKSFITDTVIEDTQNSIKLKQEGYEIVTSPEEQCVTFSPVDLKALKVQRIRWASGCLKIAKDLFISILNKRSGLNTFREKILGINYVLGLNLLPIVITMMYFIESPFHYQYFFVETIPFFLYIVSYVSLVRSLTNYRLVHIFDGLAVNQFLNLYHLAGAFSSVRTLLKGQKKKFFKSTPKVRALMDNQLGNLEFFGIIFIVIWLGLRFMNQLSLNIYYDIFPAYHIVLVLYGVYRFRSPKDTLVKVGSTCEKGRRGLPGEGSVTFMKSFKKENYIKVLRLFAIMVTVTILCVIPIGTKIYGWIELEHVKQETALKLFDGRTGYAPLDAFKQAERLGRGLNIGNALEAPREGMWGFYLKDEHFKIISDAGFDTIRIPVRWSAHAQKRKPYTIDESFFLRIDRILLKAKEKSLNVVLDFHGYDEIYFDTDGHSERFVAIWAQIAKRYKDCDSSLYYEIINEPCQNLTPEKWNVLVKDTISEIRKYDSYHTIVLTGATWGTAFGLEDLEIPSGENNIICTFHTYTPTPFTHQGVNYAEMAYYYIRDIVWPGPPKEPVVLDNRLKSAEWLTGWIDDYNTVPYEFNPAGPKPLLDELDFAYKWGKDNNRPIWLGEFGATINADITSRINWTRFIVKEAEKRGMTWAYWDFATSCRVYDPDKGKWEEGLLGALFQ